jgi:hypothetical protein
MDKEFHRFFMTLQYKSYQMAPLVVVVISANSVAKLESVKPRLQLALHPHSNVPALYAIQACPRNYLYLLTISIENGQCEPVPLNGTSCSDERWCTLLDICIDGECKGFVRARLILLANLTFL